MVTKLSFEKAREGEIMLSTCTDQPTARDIRALGMVTDSRVVLRNFCVVDDEAFVEPLVVSDVEHGAHV